MFLPSNHNNLIKCVSLHILSVLIIKMLNYFFITYSILINNILYDFLFFKKKNCKNVCNVSFLRNKSIYLFIFTLKANVGSSENACTTFWLAPSSTPSHKIYLSLGCMKILCWPWAVY